MKLTPEQAEVLHQLEARDAAERSAGTREPMSHMALLPDVARFIHTIAVHRKATRILEYGTSYGYSTIHLALAAEESNGHVHTIERLPEKATLARDHLHAAGLLERVTIHVTDGRDFILPDTFDFVLADYPVQELPIHTLKKHITPRGFLFVDGGGPDHWDDPPGSDFRFDIENDPHYISAILPLYKKHLIAIRLP